MLNRRHLRVKVLQVLYAFFQSGNDDLASGEKELFNSTNYTYKLYLYQLLLISEIGFVAEKYFDEQKYYKLHSSGNSELGSKFLNNSVLKLLCNSNNLHKTSKDEGVSWAGEHDFVRKLFSHIRNSEIYRDYLRLEKHTFEDDIKFILDIYQKLICNFEMLHHYYEEKSIYWIDDWELIVKMTIKTLKSIKEGDQDIELINLYKDQEDKEFTRQLFNKTILNHKTFDPMISEKTKNWDIERIALMDIIIMKMSLTEFLEFPDIPVKVTLNEYIELSKMYSSKKSKVFINGVLDKLVADLEKENKIKKTGKGLIDKTYS